MSFEGPHSSSLPSNDRLLRQECQNVNHNTCMVIKAHQIGEAYEQTVSLVIILTKTYAPA